MIIEWQHEYHDYDEHITIVLIIPYIASPIPYIANLFINIYA